VSGWLSGIVVTFLFGVVVTTVHPGHVTFAALPAAWVVAIGSLYFILPVSLVLVPLYLLVPRSWWLWRWPVCTSLGIVSGVCIVAVFLSQPNRNPPENVLSWYILAAVIAGTTCLVASMTYERFLPARDRI